MQMNLANTSYRDRLSQLEHFTATGAKLMECRESGRSAGESRRPRLRVRGAIRSFSRENLEGKQEPVHALRT